MSTTYNDSLRSKVFGAVQRFIEPCILLLLSKTPSHGYGLLADLATHCGEKVDIGDLYRTLRSMEMDGWVTSKWDEKQGGRNKRVYKITTDGREILKDAVASLRKTDNLIHHLFTGYQKVFPDAKIV